MEAVLVNYGIDMTDLDSIAEELPGADVSFLSESCGKEYNSYSSGKCLRMK